VKLTDRKARDMALDISMKWCRVALILAAGCSFVACSQTSFHGDTTYETAGKKFEGEMTPAQRESAIKELEAKTDKQK
jgi:hypothetical protein